MSSRIGDENYITLSIVRLSPLDSQQNSLAVSGKNTYCIILKFSHYKFFILPDFFILAIYVAQATIHYIASFFSHRKYFFLYLHKI